MHKFTLALMLSVSWGYAQDVTLADYSGVNLPITENRVGKRLLTNADFKLSNGRMQVSSLACAIPNYESTAAVLVSVVCMQKAFSAFGVDKINNMILLADEKVRNSLKTSHRYHPQEIKMVYFPDSREWSLTSFFTVQDEDGLVCERLLAVDFDTEGNFARMKYIL